MSQLFLLIVFGIITGSLSGARWDMIVSPKVIALRGEDAVLSCSFTHPKQEYYSGTITVQWLARESDSQPFFQCSVKNNSMEGLGDCSASGLRFHLDGDPRRGELSLGIRTVQLTDEGVYYCRVELDGLRQYYQKPTYLNVTAKPQILSLSVVGDGNTRRLQCEVESNPAPTITWLSASEPLPGHQVRTFESGPYRWMSSVPYPKEEQVITCRAESELGVAEQRFPHSNTLLITLTVCGLVLLLLLLLIGFTIYRLKHRVENHGLRGSEAPADGDVDPQLVYCAVSLNPQHASFKNSTRTHEEKEVVYSPVMVQK